LGVLLLARCKREQRNGGCAEREQKAAIHETYFRENP
jgi:hypothetical protein